MNILVTGSTGFIATNLILELSSHGHKLFGIDNLVSGSINLKHTEGHCRHYDLDLSSQLNSDRLCRIVERVDAVIHLAANGNVADSIVDPGANFSSNVCSTLNLLESVRAVGIDRFIFSSTGGALMGDTVPPVSEASVPMPISPYGASKLACEGYIRAYAKCYNFNSIIFRFGNVYGPFSSHKKGVINQWIRCAIRKSPVTIYGDGSSTRDYIHSSDICSGLANSLLHCFAGRNGCELFHLANGAEISLRTIHSLLSSIAGYKIPVDYKPSRVGEVSRNSAAISRASEILGFKPEIDFETGITQLYSWINKNEFDS